MTCGIYQITNIKNGKIYIGSSQNIKMRWKDHLSKLNRDKHCNRHLQRSWKKYGDSEFLFEIIEYCDDTSRILQREQWFFDNVIRWGFDYNMNNTAGRPPILMGINNPMYGKSVSSDTRRKISDANKKNTGEKSSFYGKYHSPSAKLKIKKSQTGSGNSSSKLTEEKVLEIKKMGKSGKLTQKGIAQLFSVHQSTVSKILCGKIWGHV